MNKKQITIIIIATIAFITLSTGMLKLEKAGGGPKEYTTIAGPSLSVIYLLIIIAAFVYFKDKGGKK